MVIGSIRWSIGGAFRSGGGLVIVWLVMAVLTKAIFEAVLATVFAAGAAGRQAGAAVMLATALASAHAIGAQAPLAAVAAQATLTAEIRVAAVAVATIIIVGQAAAVLATNAQPSSDLDIRTASGVGAQQARNDQKEVTQPAGIESRLDCRAAITLAEVFVLDVRMRNGFIGSSRVRLQGDNTIGLTADQATDVKSDLERPQVRIIQDDRIGRDGKFTLRQIDLHLPKLVVDRQDLSEDLRLGRKLLWGSPVATGGRTPPGVGGSTPPRARSSVSCRAAACQPRRRAKSICRRRRCRLFQNPSGKQYGWASASAGDPLANQSGRTKGRPLDRGHGGLRGQEE